MTPFAAYITLKKSTQKDKNGVNTIPSPPVLFLLQEAHREITYLNEENKKLKDATEMYRSESDKLAHEVSTLNEALGEGNEALTDSKTKNTNLHDELEKMRKQFESIEGKKIDIENKLKVTKKSL